jgi:hypothetical protein
VAQTAAVPVVEPGRGVEAEREIVVMKKLVGHGFSSESRIPPSVETSAIVMLVRVTPRRLEVLEELAHERDDVTAQQL